MKKRLAAAAAALAIALSMSGCALEDMLEKLDSSLESEEVSSVEDDSADESTPDPIGDDSSEDGSDTPQESSAAENDSTSSEDEPEEEIDDSRFIANAKAVVTSWFGLMSAAQYTDAFKLCTDDFINKHYPAGLTDGEDPSVAKVEFYDGSEEFDTDSYRRRRVKLRIKIMPEDYPAMSMDGFVYVVMMHGQFLISDVDNADSVGLSTLSDQDVYLFARLTCETAEVYKDRVEAGIYTTGDGSFLDNTIPEYTPGGTYVIYYGEGRVEAVEYTAGGITVRYPDDGSDIFP